MLANSLLVNIGILKVRVYNITGSKSAKKKKLSALEFLRYVCWNNFDIINSL